MYIERERERELWRHRHIHRTAVSPHEKTTQAPCQVCLAGDLLGVFVFPPEGACRSVAASDAALHLAFFALPKLFGPIALLPLLQVKLIP